MAPQWLLETHFPIRRGSSWESKIWSLSASRHSLPRPPSILVHPPSAGGKRQWASPARDVPFAKDRRQMIVKSWESRESDVGDQTTLMDLYLDGEAEHEADQHTQTNALDHKCCCPTGPPSDFLKQWPCYKCRYSECSFSSEDTASFHRRCYLGCQRTASGFPAVSLSRAEHCAEPLRRRQIWEMQRSFLHSVAPRRCTRQPSPAYARF